MSLIFVGDGTCSWATIANHNTRKSWCAHREPVRLVYAAGIETPLSGWWPAASFSPLLLLATDSPAGAAMILTPICFGAAVVLKAVKRLRAERAWTHRIEPAIAAITQNLLRVPTAQERGMSAVPGKPTLSGV